MGEVREIEVVATELMALVVVEAKGGIVHGSQSRSRPPTRRALRRIGLGDSDRYRAIRTKRYIESSKNFEKITTNLEKNVDIHIHVSHVQNISPSTLNIKRKYKYTRRW